NSVDSVQFLIDGQRVSSATNTPYEFTWNSITHADSMEHDISAKAFDPAENTGESHAVAVVVVPAVISFGDDVQPIFSVNCAVSGCHNAATATQGLSLESNDAHANIVDRPSSEMQSLDRIEPGDPANSFLYLKLNPSPPSGQRMPFGGPYLSEEQILTIRFWIEQGAQNN
ncbi:MAG TPA: Ig-like domain-containing protein, partial [bacterium]|nr:Ig-like domain-containing protein [bacterium]